MRLLGKILALPFLLITGMLYVVCKLFVLVSGSVLGILSLIVFLAAVGISIASGVGAGAAWLAIALLISPFGLSMLAARLTGKLGGARYALKDFILG